MCNIRPRNIFHILVRSAPSPLPSLRRVRLPADATRSREAPPPPARSITAARIGDQVHSLRVVAGISAGALARESGISRSMLSRIERGLVSASVETLEAVAFGLGIPVARLFHAPVSEADFSHVLAGQGIQVAGQGVAAGYHYELLGHKVSGPLVLEPCRVTLSPDARPFVSAQGTGVKLVQWISGRSIYRYGSRTVDLQAGDTVLFDAATPHGIESLLDGPASFLSVSVSLKL